MLKVNSLGFKLTFEITRFILIEMVKIWFLKLQSLEPFDQVVASKKLPWLNMAFKNNPDFDRILKLLNKNLNVSLKA